MPDTITAGIYVAVWIATLGIGSQLVGTLQGIEKIRLAVLFDGTIGKLLSAAGLGTLFATQGAASLRQVLFIFVASEFVSMGLAGICVQRLLRSYPQRGPSIPVAELWRNAWPFLLHQFTGMLAAQADVIVLGLFRSAAEVANYGTASRLAGLLGVPRSRPMCRLRRRSPD